MSARFIDHPVFSQDAWNSLHPLAYSRQQAVRELARAMGWLDDAAIRIPELPGKAILTRFHDADYVDALEHAVATGKVRTDMRERYGFGTMENPIFPGLWDRARATVGGALLAVELALEGHLAFHPAGGTHHGKKGRASGFCYFNDPVFAVLGLLDAGLKRVLYVDIDAHHGDGVFDAFADDPRVACVSTHEMARWPHTGGLDDQSERVLNVPTPRAVNDIEYAMIAEQLLLPFCRRFAPQAVVITCGADALAGDPLSKMRLGNQTLWQTVMDLCALSAATVILGGGGYNPWTTTRCWAGLWGKLCDLDIQKGLPPAATKLLAGFESDLIDEDEIEPHWLSSLLDPLSDDEVRPETTELIERLRRVHSL